MSTTSSSNSLLSRELTRQVLDFLGCPAKPPSLRYLNRLIQAHIQRVPWESVSRIVKRRAHSRSADCPRWPEEFWREAISFGTGGTCFECNLAFYTLLVGLGFDGYLTINDMLPQRGCHTAAVIALQGRKYLVDVAIPLTCALPFKADGTTRRTAWFHDYTIRALGRDSYEIERSHHPKRNIFTLRDTPIALEAYRAALQRDYEPGGYFLDRVIIDKVVAGRLWRFNSLERPYKLEGFDRYSRQEIPLPAGRLTRMVAHHFGIAEDKIAVALAAVAEGA